MSLRLITETVRDRHLRFADFAFSCDVVTKNRAKRRSDSELMNIWKLEFSKQEAIFPRITRKIQIHTRRPTPSQWSETSAIRS